MVFIMCLQKQNEMCVSHWELFLFNRLIPVDRFRKGLKNVTTTL